MTVYASPAALVRHFIGTAAEAVGLGPLPDPGAPPDLRTDAPNASPGPEPCIVVPPITALLKDARRDLDTDPCDQRALEPSPYRDDHTAACARRLFDPHL